MRIKIIIGVLLSALLIYPMQAQKAYKYRIALTDKAGTEYTLENPQDFLSQRALERRTRQQLMVDSTDLPVSKVYLQELMVAGSRIVTTSKWNNTVVIEINDTTLIESLKNLSFVRDQESLDTTR